jgi:hypothetical protein
MTGAEFEASVDIMLKLSMTYKNLCDGDQLTAEAPAAITTLERMINTLIKHIDQGPA